MEEAMPALTTRAEARERAIKAFISGLDRIIPANEAVPLRGGTFREWENQVEELRKAILPTVLEERAALEENALAVDGGHCPFCSSDRIYLEPQAGTKEVISPHGPALIPRQQARCRCCDRSFSPSGT
jgi:hypothetical protein